MDGKIFESFQKVIETRIKELWQEKKTWFSEDMIAIQENGYVFRILYKCLRPFKKNGYDCKKGYGKPRQIWCFVVWNNWNCEMKTFQKQEKDEEIVWIWMKIPISWFYPCLFLEHEKIFVWKGYFFWFCLFNGKTASWIA